MHVPTWLFERPGSSSIPGAAEPSDIDMLLLCTQTPDYFLPTTACMVQERLGISTEAGALDFNLGCSGFVYGLGIAKGLIETGQADTILLVTLDTYSKLLRESDRSVRTLFGDAGGGHPDRDASAGFGAAHRGPRVGHGRTGRAQPDRERRRGEIVGRVRPFGAGGSETYPAGRLVWR